ncbi:unnamed protein product [Pedinophyceae sp. YPF-701]|nr:unnamed protein product [Pedinophyceae sp. YPF-701]
MTFKFGFAKEDAEAGAPSSDPEDGELGAGAAAPYEHRPGSPAGCAARARGNERFDTVAVGPQDRPVAILKGRVTGQDAAELLGAACEASDLVAGRYEGGFKLWECSVDLANVLCERWELAGCGGAPGLPRTPSRALAGRSVVELGCGHAVPGILALLGGAETVVLQDFNPEVVRALVVPNCEANAARLAAEGAQLPRETRFLSGDWGQLDDLLLRGATAGGFDLVLASETVYAEAAARRFYRLLTKVLKRPGGEAYVAGKAYYFGVGGGTQAFEELVRRGGVLGCEVVWRCDDGRSNVREVLRLWPL